MESSTEQIKVIGLRVPSAEIFADEVSVRNIHFAHFDVPPPPEMTWQIWCSWKKLETIPTAAFLVFWLRVGLCSGIWRHLLQEVGADVTMVRMCWTLESEYKQFYGRLRENTCKLKKILKRYHVDPALVSAQLRLPDGDYPMELVVNIASLLHAFSEQLQERKKLSTSLACWTCGAIFEHKGLKCSACMIAHYCSEACQKQQYKEHRKLCKKLAQWDRRLTQ